MLQSHTFFGRNVHAMTSKNIAVLLLVGGVIAVAGFKVLNRLYDSSRAAKVATVVREAVASKSELRGMFGSFIRLSGDGYTRAQGIVLIPRIELERVAEFERASVGVHITVFDTPIKGDQDWHIGQWKLVDGGKFRYALQVSMQPGSTKNGPLEVETETK